jgi:hypothetical protein
MWLREERIDFFLILILIHFIYLFVYLFTVYLFICLFFNFIYFMFYLCLFIYIYFMFDLYLFIYLILFHFILFCLCFQRLSAPQAKRCQPPCTATQLFFKFNLILIYFI